MLVRILLVLAFVMSFTSSVRADELADLEAFAKASNGQYYKHGDKQCRLEFGKQATDTDLITLGKMPVASVQSLNIILCEKITDTGFLALNNMSNLEGLILPSQLSDAAYVGMAKRFPKVDTVSISVDFFKGKSPLTILGLKSIAGMPSVRAISVHRTLIDDKCWVVLSKSSRLMNLTITDSKLTGGGIENLSKCNRLNNLDLEKLVLTDVGVGQIAKIDSLAIIRMVGCGVSDQGLVGLSKHSGLWSVTLQGDPISDSGVKSLGNIMTLSDVTISSSQITDVAYNHLSAMAKLNTINIRGPKLTPQGKTAFQKAMPKVKVN